MSRLPGREVELLRHVRGELATVRCDGQPVLARIVEPIHELLGGELFWTFRPVRTLTAWDVEEAHADGSSNDLLESSRHACAASPASTRGSSRANR